MTGAGPVSELQHRFQHAILADINRPGMLVDEDVKLVGGFDLYLGAYRARLVEALRDNFSVLHRALGDDGFGELAAAYIRAHPSHFRSIRWYGDQLPSFLDANPAFLPHPALSDLARMDWALRGAFDAPDSRSLALADLAALPPEQWPQHCFATIPSLDIVDLSWSVEPIWRALNDDPEAQTDSPEPLAHVLLVWRPGLETMWRAVDSLESESLTVLRSGATFTEYCETIATHDVVDPAAVAVGYLQRWVLDGVLLANGDTNQWAI